MKDRQLIEIICLTEEIMQYFDDVIEGICADLAYYELLIYVKKYFKSEKSHKGFFEYIDMIFNIDQKDFRKILKNYANHMKEIKKYNILGEE